jgi:hypothetical protein
MATLTEDFEDTTYVVPLSGDWVRTNAAAHAGSWSLGAQNATEETATFTLPSSALTVRFWYNAVIDDFSILSVELNSVSIADLTTTGGSWVQSAILNVAGGGALSFFAGSFATDITAYIDDLVIETSDSAGEFSAWGIPI